MLIAIVSTLAGVLLAAVLAFFAWVALSIIWLKESVAGMRGDLGREVAKLEAGNARMESRLLAAIYGRKPPESEGASHDRAGHQQMFP